MDGLRHAKPVAPVVPLHVLFQVHGELAIGIGGAGDPGQGVLTAARTELLAHVLGGEEASVAAFDERLEMPDPLQGSCRKQIQVHLKQDVLALRWQLVCDIDSEGGAILLTAKSVVMVATCITLGSGVVEVLPSSRACRFL